MAQASWPALPPPSRGGGGHLAESFSPSWPSPGPPSYVSGSSGSIDGVEVPEPRWVVARWTGHLELEWLSMRPDA